MNSATTDTRFPPHTTSGYVHAAPAEERPPTTTEGQWQSTHGAARRRPARSPKAQLFVTICHWAMVVLLGLNLLTGMRIGWGFQQSPLGGYGHAWGSLLGAVSPKGTLFGVNLITLHVVLAFAVLLVVSVYVGYLIRSRTTRRFGVTRRHLEMLASGIRAERFWRNRNALWSANLLSYWFAFLLVAVLFATGVALYRVESGLATVFGGYSVARVLHAIVAYLLIPFAVLHAVLQWFFGRFWTIFKAHVYRPHVRAGLTCVAVALPIVAAAYLADAVPTTLTVKRITGDLRAPLLDGDASDPAWRAADAVTIRTVKGVNNPQDYVDVEVKALYDGNQVYFLFQWDDPDASYKRFPLQKTAKGWKVLQTAFENSDENVYYEDKLSVYFTGVRNRSCAATCHLGVGPAAAKEEKHGLHYTAGEVGDLWHWKAVRTNPMGGATGEPGFLDDQHFRAPDPLPAKPGERYTGGYFADPQTGGGYAYNFEKLDPTKSVAETYVRPKMLPTHPFQVLDPDAKTSDHETAWWIHKAQGIPYAPARDRYPVGSLIPNILLAPFEGDRGDVRAVATWRVGRWTLETRRRLDTRSSYDVAFVPGQPLYMSVATYNRTQTRHGEHISAVRVTLEK